MAIEQRGHKPNRRARLLLILPFIGVLWVPWYNRIEPSFFGVPFFYSYQLAWIVLCAVICLIVYRAEH